VVELKAVGEEDPGKEYGYANSSGASESDCGEVQQMGSPEAENEG